MTLKERLLGASLTLAGITGNALAATNTTTDLLNPDAARGREHLASLPYVDKLQYILDIVFAIVPIIAIGALAWLTLTFLAGGWDSVENELRVRKKYFTVIGVLLALKIGSAAVRLIDTW
jgi:hypothetical protein